MFVKKLIAILLCLAAVAVPLVSCGDSESAAPSGAETQGNNEAAAESAETQSRPSEYVNPNVDYQGEEFCLSSYDSESYFWHAASYCEVWAEEEMGDPINDSIFRRNRSVEEALNIKLTHYGIDISSRNIADDIKRLILAGEDMVDVALVTGSGIPTMVGTGDMVLDLNKIGTLDLSHSWWDQTSVNSLRILESNYAVTGDISLYAQFSPVVYFVNKYIIDSFSLDNPYELVRNGGWTIDKAFEYIAAVSYDVNGDGVRGIEDAYGMCCESGSMNYILGACGIKMTELDSENVPKLSYNTERTANLVEKLMPLILNKDHVAFSDYYSGYGNVFTELLIPMFMDNRILFYNNQLLIAMNLRDMEADFGILPAPKYDETQSNYIGITNTSWVTFVVVPATNVINDMTGNVLEAMGYYSQQLVTPAYIETTVLNKTMRDDDSAEMLRIILDSRAYDLAYYYNWGSITSIATSLYSSKSTNFASTYTKSEKAIQSAIDATVESIKNK